jgi:hypothetical protein
MAAKPQSESLTGHEAAIGMLPDGTLNVVGSPGFKPFSWDDITIIPDKSVQTGSELFYKDAKGKKQDAALHEPILAGDHHIALQEGKEVARRAGISEEMILKLYAEPVLAAGNEDSARQIGIEAARRAGLTEEEIAKLYAPLDSSPDPNQKPE